MKRNLVSIAVAFLAMVFSCAAVFADTVVFDKKNKGNEKDFVESEFNSIKELEALCKKYPKNNAEVLVKFDDDLTVEYVTEMNNKINEIHKCFKTELDLMSFGTSTFNKKGNVYVFKFTYESGKYSPKYSLIESNVVAFFDFKMSSNYFDDDNLKKALKTQQQYEFNTLTELEKFFKTHKEKSFSLTIPANSKIQSTKDFENLSKFLYNNSLYKNSMEQKKFLDAVLAILRPPVVIDSYILVDGHKTYRTVFIDKEENSYVVAAQKEIWENERKENEKAGLGKLTNDEVEKERRKNEADGHGRLTNAEILSAERKANEKAGLGKLTNSEVEKERKTNEAAGLGKLTNTEVNTERVKNEKAGLGKITNAEAEKERKANEVAGLVLVEGGTFEMGSTNGDNDEMPVHKVTVSSFYMCDHEVTQKEYRNVTGKKPSEYSGDNRPVECVSWYDAIEYCNKRSIAEGLTPCYTIDEDFTTCNFKANGYRLPTEAEWEYAARGGKKSNGYDYSGSNTLGNVAWYDDNSGYQTHDVKTKSPNELGLYDMTGNVWEWCWDWYGSYSSSSQTNPLGAVSGSGRILRGGSWYHSGNYYCRIAVRAHDTPSGTDNNLGFRVVRSNSKSGKVVTEVTSKSSSSTTSAQSIKSDFTLVEGGTYSMGSPSGYSNEKPVHKVTVSSFYMCDHEVTQKEYRNVTGKNPSEYSGDNRPVECVSWYEAVEFCNALSRMEGLTPCYIVNGDYTTCNFSADGYRLPTEAEWEFAARGGNKSSGYIYSGRNTLGNVAWYGDNSGEQTHDVKTKSPNELGLYDMSGNVMEWCWDWNGSYSSSSQTNPTGSGEGAARIVRGGGWDLNDTLCRVAFRSYVTPSYSGSILGFRVVRSSIK